MSHQDEKPGPALEDRFRERFAQERYNFRKAVSDFDSEWTVPTDPAGIIPSLKTPSTPPPPSERKPTTTQQTSTNTTSRILLFVVIATLVVALLNFLIPIAWPSKDCANTKSSSPNTPPLSTSPSNTPWSKT